MTTLKCGQSVFTSRFDMAYPASREFRIHENACKNGFFVAIFAETHPARLS
jgi:hypothetical protein